MVVKSSSYQGIDDIRRNNQSLDWSLGDFLLNTDHDGMVNGFVERFLASLETRQPQETRQWVEQEKRSEMMLGRLSELMYIVCSILFFQRFMLMQVSMPLVIGG